MPRLDTADAVYFGTQAASLVYLGTNIVWGALEAPINVSVPTITGAAAVGQVGALGNGTWSGSPTSYARQLQIWDAVNSEWDDVPGATGTTHTFTVDGDYRLRVVATNSEGDSDPAYSATVAIAEAPTGFPFITGYQVDLSSSDMVATRGSSGTGNYGSAWTDVLTSGKVYFEMEVDSTTGEVDVGLWKIDTVTPQPWWNNQDFSFHGGSTIKVTIGSQWSMNYYCDTTYTGGPVPDTTDMPVYRIGFAYDPATGAAWFRQVWSTGVGAYIGGGNPATGTTPTFTLTSAAGQTNARIAASFDQAPENVRIITPDNHLGSAPAGFTPV